VQVRTPHRAALVLAVSVTASPLAATQAPTPAAPPTAPAAIPPEVAAYADTARRLIEAASTTKPTAWDRLAELTDTFGHRLSGSASLEAALRWGAEQMRADGLENVRLEPVLVPRWVRGRESAELLPPLHGELALLGLGNSVGTPPEGIEADVVIVSSFDELERLGRPGVDGRIVLYDVPYTRYGATVEYRSSGASRAAKLGARAILLRSVGLPGLRTPHTGALRYADDAPRIPAAAVALEDAQRLRRLHQRGLTPRVRLRMEARFEADAPSANLVGEIVGRESPHEVVLVGGHIDSWDVGTGAMDDGAGCVMTWQALTLVKRLGLRPRRTLRVVLFTNEENGLRGGLAYRDAHLAELKDHVAALESDSGGFRPLGFGFSGGEAARATVRAIGGLLEPLQATRVEDEGGGADIGPLAKAGGVPTLSLDVDGERYFAYHHTPADTLERLEPEHLAQGAAAVAVMGYVLADLEQRLPR
jgi:carboxypeptidase Q